jgi:hypothetical protein
MEVATTAEINHERLGHPPEQDLTVRYYETNESGDVVAIVEDSERLTFAGRHSLQQDDIQRRCGIIFHS